MSNEKIGAILFVDDEVSVLKAIRRQLFDSVFELHFAESGHEAIALLEDTEVDIIVTDYKMPIMNGISLLKIVKKRFPDITRLILSGYVQQDAVMQALISGVASTYFSKPWNDVSIEEKLLNIMKIRGAMRDKELLSLIQSVGKLPVLPDIYNEVEIAIQNEDSLDKIVSILEKDVSLTTRVLQIANSAFYGLNNNSSLKHAISYIGQNALKDIMLLYALTEAEDISDYQLEKLRDLSTQGVILNRALISLLEEIVTNQQAAFTSSIGILMQVGKIIQLKYFPLIYNKINDYMAEHGCTYFEADIEVGEEGANYLVLGGYFLDLWNIPLMAVESVMFSQSPEKASEEYRDIVEIIGMGVRLFDTVRTVEMEEILDYTKFKHKKVRDQKVKDVASQIWRDLRGKELF